MEPQETSSLWVLTVKEQMKMEQGAHLVTTPSLADVMSGTIGGTRSRSPPDFVTAPSSAKLVKLRSVKFGKHDIRQYPHRGGGVESIPENHWRV